MIVTQKQLDDTDKEIIRLAGEGLTTKEIAFELSLKQKSVEAKLREMRRWYQCKKTVDLVLKIKTEILNQ